MKVGLILGSVFAMLGIVALSAQGGDSSAFTVESHQQNILSTNLVAAQHRDYILIRKKSGLYI